MENRFVLLTVRETMWAEMLMQVLQDNGIPCTSLPERGIGFEIHTGVKDNLKVFVPEEHLSQANALLEELFSAEFIEE